MTLEQFLAWEARQEERYEFDGFGPVAMAGGTAIHAAIQVNLLIALGSRLRGKPCRACGSELKILVAGRIRYPDAFVSCKAVGASETVLTEPVVVFEVLSNGTSNEDLVVKNAEYRATHSIQRYVILQHNEAGALVFSRKGDDWIAETFSGGEAVLTLPEIRLEIPLDEIYTDLPPAAEST